MTKKKKNDFDDMYAEDLVWMSYRYAIGLKNEQEDEYFNVDFDSEEYHQLVAEFREFLKKRRKKSVPLKVLPTSKVDDLIWLSFHYGLGRHTYAAMHSGEIATHGYNRLSQNRKDFIAKDIRHEIFDRLNWGHMNFHCDLHLQDLFDPIDLLMRFLKDRNVTNIKTLRGFTNIEPVLENGEIKFISEWSSEESHKNSYYYASDFESYFCWEDLANCFDSKAHKWCKVNFDGKEQYIEYFDSWVRDYSHNVYYEDIAKAVKCEVENGVPIDTPEQRVELALKLEKKFDIDDYGFDRQEKYKETRTAEDIGIMVYRTYMDVMHPENFLYYKKIKRPIDSYLANPHVVTSINENYIVEDNISNYETPINEG